jgi:hypothetical protein
MLQAQGIEIVEADSPTTFIDDGPTSRLVRQLLGAVTRR